MEMTTRAWLLANGYHSVVELIDQVMATLKAKGSKERRNWWDVLSGGVDGAPTFVAGREFPVLRVAQIRQGKPVTDNAVYLSDDEVPPGVVRTGRWQPKRRRLPSKSRAVARKPARKVARHARAS